MIHKKIYNATTVKTPKGTLIVEGPVPTHKLENYKFHEDLTAFRPAPQQYKAVIDISKLPEARIIVARLDDLIIGYVTYLYPDPLERWSQGNMENLIELGAVEVIPAFRGYSVGKTMLQVSMMDDNMEDYIIITTEYY